MAVADAWLFLRTHALAVLPLRRVSTRFPASMGGLAPRRPLTDRQHRILQAATQVFAERGFEGAATAEIAQRAQVSEGAMFKRFRTKKDLLLAVTGPYLLEIGAPDLVPGLASALADESGGLEPLLRAIIRDRIEFARNHPAVIRILVPWLTPTGGRLGLPADFLIASDGRTFARGQLRFACLPSMVGRRVAYPGPARVSIHYSACGRPAAQCYEVAQSRPRFAVARMVLVSQRRKVHQRGRIRRTHVKGDQFGTHRAAGSARVALRVIRWWAGARRAQATLRQRQQNASEPSASI
jgi:AcrR family transcriptional regulator